MKQFLTSKRYYLLFLFPLILACGKGKEEFIPLDKLTFINSYYKDSKKISYYILIDNPDTSIKELQHKIIKYVRSRQHEISPLDSTGTVSLNFVFYQKTNKTSYFINNSESSNVLSSEEIAHCKEDYIANYHIKKCEKGRIEELYLYERPVQVVMSNCETVKN